MGRFQESNNGGVYSSPMESFHTQRVDSVGLTLFGPIRAWVQLTLGDFDDVQHIRGLFSYPHVRAPHGIGFTWFPSDPMDQIPPDPAAPTRLWISHHVTCMAPVYTRRRRHGNTKLYCSRCQQISTNVLKWEPQTAHDVNSMSHAATLRRVAAPSASLGSSSQPLEACIGQVPKRPHGVEDLLVR